MSKLLVLLISATAIVLGYLWSSPTEEAAILEDIDIPDVLRDSPLDYRQPEVIKVVDGVYVAVGYSMATVTMIVGDDGVIIVDTTESTTTASKVREQFRRITDKPTTLIIYTHHHGDHVGGAKAFVTPGAPAPEVWAHEQMTREERLLATVSDITLKRTAFQFGLFIEEYRFKTFYGNGSLASAFRVKSGRLPPTRFLKGDEDLTVAGVRLRILHIPGETADHIGLWLPDWRVAIAADDLYRSFPNLYAIRGTTPRHATDWIRSLERLMALRPLHLISGHYEPLHGEEPIAETLADYRAAIQFVHDQTVRLMNKGQHPDEIANAVRLHADFDGNAFLRQIYGTVPWSTKAIYETYLGWFSGSAVDLTPLAPSERATRMVRLVGADGLLRAAEVALVEGDDQWALELASHVFVADRSDGRALALRRSALRRLAGRMTSLNGRNYLMSVIWEDAGKLNRGLLPTLVSLPAGAIIKRLRYRISAERVPIGENITGCFAFTDSSTSACVHLFRSVLRFVTPTDGGHLDFRVSLTEGAFKEILASVGSGRMGKVLRRGDITIKGDFEKLEKFFSYIDME